MRLSHLQEADEFSADRNHGVEKEINNFAIYINGRLWKVIKGVAPDDDPEQVRKAEQLRRMCEQKTLATGKIWTCLETSQEPTDTLKPAGTPPTSSSPIPSSDSDITTNFQVFINGRSWRVFPGAGPDNSLAQRNEMSRLQKMCDRKSVQTGRKWEVKPTKAEPTPAGPRPHITEKQINMPTRFSPGDEVRVKNHPELQGVLVKMLADNAALVNFEIDDDHEPIESEVDLTDLEPATLHEQDVEENLDANQRRAGQAGPMDKAPLRGKLVGGDAMEGLPGSLSNSDYTSGATQKHANTNCTTCHGRKVMYKLDGKLLADNKVGAVKVKCPTCHGTGDKPDVAEGEGGLGQVAGIGINGKQFNFSIKDLIAKAQNYPIKKLNPQLFVKQLADRHEDPKQTAARAQSADLQYPIIVVQDGNTLMIADGTHRAQKAIMNKLPSINAYIIPVEDMAEFSKQGVAEGDVFFIEMGDTLIETTVLRANHDTVLLAADDTAMSLLEASNVMEAKYHGRNVPLGKPMQGDVKKFKVYVKDPKTGNVKKVNFGDPNMRIKKSNPKRRKSFRARHNCANPGPRTKARYWSCRKW